MSLLKFHKYLNVKHLVDCCSIYALGVKDAFLYVYGDAENDDGEFHGYSKTMDAKGQDGYKHRDKFHKQDGDKYRYEVHSEFGQANRAKIENENDKGLKKAIKEGTKTTTNAPSKLESLEYTVVDQLHDQLD